MVKGPSNTEFSGEAPSLAPASSAADSLFDGATMLLFLEARKHVVYERLDV